MLMQRAIDGLADSEVGIKGDEVLIVEIPRGDDPSAGQTMRRMADEEHDLGAPREDGERTVRGRVGEQAQVRLVIQDGLDDPVRVEVLQPHLGLGIERHEALHVIAHDVDADRVYGRDPDDSGHLRSAGGDGQPDLFVAFKQGQDAVGEGLAFGCEHERPLAAVDEADVQLALELLDRLSGCGLRDLVGRSPL